MSKSYFKLLVATGLMMSGVALAGTDLPYIGPEMLNCNIKVPQGDKFGESGYYTSENCKIIYVKPPLVGSFVSAKPILLPDVKLCGLINKLYDKLTEVTDVILKGDGGIKQAIAQANEIRNSIDQLSGNKTVSTVSIAAKLNWSEKIAQYKELNPDADVRPLPIAVGLFATNTHVKTTGSFSASLDNSIINDLRVYGVKLPSNFSAADQAIPDVLKNFNNEDDDDVSENKMTQIIMGDALGIGMDLNLAGTCAYLNSTHPNGAKSPAAYLASTYTYFYPIQTKSLFKITLNEVELEKSIMSIVQTRGGHITLAELETAVKTNNAVDIVRSGGAFPNTDDGAALEQEYKQSLLETALTTILTNVSSKVEALVNSATYTVQEQRSGESCSGHWIFKHCHNYTYTVAVSKINWTQVKANLESVMGSANAEASTYKSIYMIGTSAIMPSEMLNETEGK